MAKDKVSENEENIFFFFFSANLPPILLLLCHRLTQYVFMSEQHCVVDLRLSEPGLFISRREDFNSHILPLPLPPPHLSIPPFAWEGGLHEEK